MRVYEINAHRFPNHFCEGHFRLKINVAKMIPFGIFQVLVDLFLRKLFLNLDSRIRLIWLKTNTNSNKKELYIYSCFI